MTKPFIILTTQRTGSTWVVDMLDSHPGVTAYSELFLQGGSGRPRWGGARDLVFWETFVQDRRGASDARPVRALLFDYLDRIFAPRARVEAAGFKLMYGQAGAYPDVVAYAAERGVAVVHLVRRNHLDVLLSREVAVRRGQFHAHPGDAVADVRVALETGGLVEQLRRQEAEVARARRRLAALGVPRLEVSYETLAAGGGFDELLAFLGVSGEGLPLRSSLQKMITRSHRALIENYEETRAALRGTPFHDLLR